jgi:hypothetical protein
MTIDDDMREARAQENRARQAILKLAAEIRTVLSEDLAQFPAWEVRRRFVENPGLADSLSDEAISKIKEFLAQEGPRVRDEVVAALEDPEPWLAGLACTGPGKSLAENTVLWRLTEPVAKLARDALVNFGFPSGESPEYRMPMRFIGRKYLPGLAEKYWSLVGDLRDAMTRLGEIDESRRREELGKRWDRIG